MRKPLFIFPLLFLLCIPTGKALSGTRLQDGVSDLHTVEDILFESHYQTSADFVKWEISNNKAIEIQLSVKSNPSNKIILMNYMYAVIYVESRQEYYDDIEQDHMDDYNTGVDQSGFLINANYSYHETFSVMGLSNDFLEMINAGFARDPDQQTYSYVERLTESDLLNRCHICGQTLYIVYDLMIKNIGEDYFHKIAISDNIYIDNNGTVLLNKADLVEQLTENTEKDKIDGYDTWIFVGCGVAAVGVILKRKLR